MTRQRLIDRVNASQRAHNRRIARELFARVDAQPKKPSRKALAICKQGHEDALLALQENRSSIRRNSKNMEMPRLCPRW